MSKGFETLNPLGSRLARAATLGVALVLAGCMSDRSEVAGGPSGVSASPAAASSGDNRSALTKIISGGGAPHQIDPEAYAADLYCPSIRLIPNTHLIMNFERNADEDPRKLLYQATVSDWARGCTREGTDQVRIKVGVSGHVTPGPAWKGGEVLLPVKVMIVTPVEEEKAVYDQVLNVPVTLGAGTPSEAWTLVDSSFVVPRDREMQILVGFDEKALARR